LYKLGYYELSIDYLKAAKMKFLMENNIFNQNIVTVKNNVSIIS